MVFLVRLLRVEILCMESSDYVWCGEREWEREIGDEDEFDVWKSYK